MSWNKLFLRGCWTAVAKVSWNEEVLIRKIWIWDVTLKVQFRNWMHSINNDWNIEESKWNYCGEKWYVKAIQCFALQRQNLLNGCILRNTTLRIFRTGLLVYNKEAWLLNYGTRRRDKRIKNWMFNTMHKGYQSLIHYIVFLQKLEKILILMCFDKVSGVVNYSSVIDNLVPRCVQLLLSSV